MKGAINVILREIGEDPESEVKGRERVRTLRSNSNNMIQVWKCGNVEVWKYGAPNGREEFSFFETPLKLVMPHNPSQALQDSAMMYASGLLSATRGYATPMPRKDMALVPAAVAGLSVKSVKTRTG
jgi:hypothetical protein